MLPLHGRLIQTASRLLGFPSGTGELVDHPTRVRLLVSLLGSLVLAGLELLGVLAILPLMQFVAGVNPTSGALGIVRRVVGNPDDDQLMPILAALVVGTFLIKDVCAFLFRRWQLRFMAAQEVAMSTQVLRGYLTGPYSWQLVKNTGDKVFTIEGAVSIGFTSGLGSALAVITEIVTIVLIVGGLLVVSPGVTVAVVAYFAIAAIAVQRVIRPRILRASQRSTAASLATANASLRALTVAKEIKLRRAHEPFVEHYHRDRARGAQARSQAAMLGEIPKYVLEILFISAVGLIAVYASLTGGTADLLVTLALFVAAGTRILPSTVRLIGALSGIRFAREPLALLVQVVRSQRDAERLEQSQVVTDTVPTGDIEVSGVRFAYESRPDTPVLDDVHLRIPMGQSVALVGSSGSGKTTLVDVLLGLHRPEAGIVTAGGVNIHDNLPGWQRQLAVVPQDVVLLDATLASNIAFELPLDPQRLADVVERAQLSELVSSLPDGLETQVGERGARLSGGQRQRIGIARALYRQPTVLFLDEATSALDNETERRLTETIFALQGPLTIVIVAHRLSTVQHCSQLIFMSQGRVETTGTFQEVEQANPEFAHLVRLGSLH